MALTTPFFMRASWQLTALRLGDERTRTLGVDVQRLCLVVLVGVSLLATILEELRLEPIDRDADGLPHITPLRSVRDPAVSRGKLAVAGAFAAL